MITEAYLSTFKNIFENLAFEDYLLRHTSCEAILFYVNGPCVVMGNFQNPWAEVSANYLSRKGIKLARRQSGGGSVYHDEGNLNFCCFSNKGILSEEDKSRNLKLITDLLESKGVKTQKLPKSGMTFEKNKRNYKFSGEAFKQIKGRSLHHGTLLIDSNLEDLEAVLQPDHKDLKTKAVASNPHLVGNLSDVWSDLTPELFFLEFKKFHKLSQPNIENEVLMEYVTKHTRDWSSYEQVYGKTPKFEVRQNGKTLTVLNAQVVAIDGEEITPRNFSGATS